MPFTISVFGDTANSGTVLGENPIRANYHRPAGLRPRHAHRGQVVQSRSVRHAPSLHLRQCWTKLGLWSAAADAWTSLWCALSASTERTSFQFRGEAFNALNKVNLGTPNRFVNTPQFGTITMAMTPGREIQLSARVSF